MVDFRYLTDALTPDEALALLESGAAGRAERMPCSADGYPAYSTRPAGSATPTNGSRRCATRPSPTASPS